MKLFVGLGNPGAKYEQNRHNIGFMVLDEIARIHNFDSWRKRFQSEAAEGRMGAEGKPQEKCLLLKPTTYMNESGRAVQEAMRFYKLEPEDIIVFHDELDLKPGKIKVKTGGGNAGHNGLRSISSHIGNEYIRIRLGIGHPGQKNLVHTYVLHDFTKAERNWLEPLIDAIAKTAPLLANDDSPNFMNQVALALQPEQETQAKKANNNLQSQQAKKQSKEKKQDIGPLAESLAKWRTQNDQKG